MLDIPDADLLRDLLSAPGGANVALIDPANGDPPFYVGLNDTGELVKLERS